MVLLTVLLQVYPLTITRHSPHLHVVLTCYLKSQVFAVTAGIYQRSWHCDRIYICKTGRWSWWTCKHGASQVKGNDARSSQGTASMYKTRVIWQMETDKSVHRLLRGGTRWLLNMSGRTYSIFSIYTWLRSGRYASLNVAWPIWSHSTLHVFTLHMYCSYSKRGNRIQIAYYKWFVSGFRWGICLTSHGSLLQTSQSHLHEGLEIFNK